jgi:hypothetical protein
MTKISQISKAKKLASCIFFFLEGKGILSSQTYQASVFSSCVCAPLSAALARFHPIALKFASTK